MFARLLRQRFYAHEVNSRRIACVLPGISGPRMVFQASINMHCVAYNLHQMLMHTSSVRSMLRWNARNLLMSFASCSGLHNALLAHMCCTWLQQMQVPSV